MQPTSKKSFTPRPPTWDLAIKPGDSAKWVTVGAAWDTERGNISVRLSEKCAPSEFLALLGRAKGRFMLFPHRGDDADDVPATRTTRRDPDATVDENVEPPTTPSAPAPEPDYMERKRRAWPKVPATGRPITQAQIDEPPSAPDGDAPSWLA